MEPGRDSLGEVLRTLRRRRWVVIACILLVPAAVVVISLASQKKYESKAAILFRDPGTGSKLSDTSTLAPSPDADREAETNLQLVGLDAVLRRTAVTLPGPR